MTKQQLKKAQIFKAFQLNAKKYFTFLTAIYLNSPVERMMIKKLITGAMTDKERLGATFQDIQ